MTPYNELNFQKIFESIRNAFAPEILSKPFVGIFFIIVILSLFILLSTYTILFFIRYLDKKKELLGIYDFLTSYTGFTEKEKDILKKILISKKQKPFFRPILYKNLFKTYITRKELEKHGLNYDLLWEKWFREIKNEKEE